MLEKGKKIGKNGDYELIEFIGSGSYGDVWKAEKRTTLDVNYFALKFFRPKEGEELDLDKIKDEIGVWKQLKGLPHIISVTELDQFEDYIYVVSDYADGGSLEKWLNKNSGKSSSTEEAVKITLEILTGLENLHEKGFAHRDLKPDNILIMNGKHCLADFGITREMKTHSKSTATAGTLEYMPPEAFDKKVSLQSDIWAVGVMLQELLTGNLPYNEETQAQLIMAILANAPEPLPKDIPLKLRQIVEKALQKDRQKRFQTPRKMRTALREFLKNPNEVPKPETPRKYKSTIFDEDVPKDVDEKPKLDNTTEKAKESEVPKTKSWEKIEKERKVQAGAEKLKEEERKKQLEIERQRKAEEDFWYKARKGNTLSDYKSYLQRYPKGRFVDACQKNIARIEKEEADRKAKEAKRQREKEELTLWNKARNTNKIESYQKYLRRYPNGRYVDDGKKYISLIRGKKDAERERQRLEQEKIDREVVEQARLEKRKIQIGGGITTLIVGLVLLGVWYNSASSNPNFVKDTTSSNKNGTKVSNSKTTTKPKTKDGKKVEDKKDKPKKPVKVEDVSPKNNNKFTNSIGMEFVRIPSGSFMMGSPSDEKDRGVDEGPQRRVTISKDFYMGKYEVTQEEYEKIMGTNPSYFRDCLRCPVEDVSWEDAKEFVKKLNTKDSKYKYRLPSEAEWEYAARAGTTTPFGIGDGNNLSSDEANFNGNHPYGNAKKGEYLKKTTKVGSYEANKWGLYDMHGNIWEWCEDIYKKDYNGLSSNDSINLTQGDSSKRVLRGGSWDAYGDLVRSADRNKNFPSNRYVNVGFRVVASLR